MSKMFLGVLLQWRLSNPAAVSSYNGVTRSGRLETSRISRSVGVAEKQRDCGRGATEEQRREKGPLSREVSGPRRAVAVILGEELYTCTEYTTIVG